LYQVGDLFELNVKLRCQKLIYKYLYIVLYNYTQRQYVQEYIEVTFLV